MAVTTRILLVDPSDQLADTLSVLFSQHGEFSLDHSPSTGLALERLASTTIPEILLLDSLHNDPGQACATIRAAGFAGPVLLLGDEQALPVNDEVLAMGAQGHLARPFKFGVLVARLRQLLREHENSAEAMVQIGAFRFLPADKALEAKDGGLTKLTDKEAAILRSLHRAAPRAVPRDALLEDVWGYNSGVTTHTLETHVYRLRQKLEAGPADPALLITEQGGYRLNVES